MLFWDDIIIFGSMIAAIRWLKGPLETIDEWRLAGSGANGFESVLNWS
jgi:hypothetical protein